MHGEKEIISRGKICIDNNSRAMSDDELCRMAFGLSFEQLIIAIRNNKSGKYDCLYARDNECEK